MIFCSDLKAMRPTSKIDHGSEVFGVQWNPNLRDEYLVGCMDGSVQLCNMNKSGKPEQVFRQHEKRVFNVVYND